MRAPTPAKESQLPVEVNQQPTKGPATGWNTSDLPTTCGYWPMLGCLALNLDSLALNLTALTGFSITIN